MTFLPSPSGGPAAGGPGRSLQVDEGLLVIQPFQLHQRDPGLLDHAPSRQRNPELGGQPTLDLGLGRRAE